ncbi:Sodium/glucose cotransporter [Planctomycetes bacterium Pla163]|uniref:Sodium/glucose cotransporter n=1 Tax=Rohdeia mirabilis TaxID=2528008 RepID=A0A518D0S4_9BACT|nr:Sodium/glucose cotransporter [Planctomycetes bacterium Pla163]
MPIAPLALAPATGFAAADWLVVAAYFVLLAGTGWYFARRENRNTDDYFLGGRSMPPWAVAISIVATSMSAASFVGVPESGYTGDLTYLTTNVGMVLAACVVAFLFIPAFYAERVQTIYGLLERRVGHEAGHAASWAFLVGRVFASGARIYVGAIPLSLILFGVEHGLDASNLIVAVLVLTVVGIVYTLMGGVAAVIWSDVIQMVVLLGAALGAIVLIVGWIEVPLADVFDALRTGGAPLVEGGAATSKLQLLDTRTDPRLPFTLLTAVLGFTLLGIGSYGTDQDLAQRMLTCKNAASGSRSVLMGIAFGIPSVLVFLVVGMLLWVFYQRPELMGSHAPVVAPGDDRQVFLEFILTQMPGGLRGLMMAGLFAAGLSSLNSAINAMSSTFVNDVYRRRRPDLDERALLRVGRIGVAVCGAVLGLFAVLCVVWQSNQDGGVKGGSIINFVLGIMTFAYSGLVGVFLSVLLLRRGSSTSVIAALVTGFVLIALVQPWALGSWIEAAPKGAAFGELTFLQQVVAAHFTWKFSAAVVVTFLVCAGGGPNRPARPTAPGPDPFASR